MNDDAKTAAELRTFISDLTAFWYNDNDKAAFEALAAHDAVLAVAVREQYERILKSSDPGDPEYFVSPKVFINMLLARIRALPLPDAFPTITLSHGAPANASPPSWHISKSVEISNAVAFTEEGAERIRLEARRAENNRREHELTYEGSCGVHMEKFCSVCIRDSELETALKELR